MTHRFRIYVSDEGLEHVDLAAYRREVVTQLRAIYPGADVEVMIGSGGETRIAVEGDSHDAAWHVVRESAFDALCNPSRAEEPN